MKTSELTGIALDWAVAKCEGLMQGRIAIDGVKQGFYNPSTNWSQSGPIIEREGIEVRYRVGVNLTATIDGKYEQSVPYNQRENAQLTVAMRCYVASKLGDEVDIPKELTQ